MHPARLAQQRHPQTVGSASPLGIRYQPRNRCHSHYRKRRERTYLNSTQRQVPLTPIGQRVGRFLGKKHKIAYRYIHNKHHLDNHGDACFIYVLFFRGRNVRISKLFQIYVILYYRCYIIAYKHRNIKSNSKQ